MRKVIRRGVILGALAGAVYAIWKLIASRTQTTNGGLGVTFESQAFPMPPRPVPTTPPTPKPAPPELWVEPVDGACPTSHPVKAKLSSGIFHTPSGRNYERTIPDRCYLDPGAAEADGLRASKT